MSETSKTFAFVAAAVVALGAALFVERSVATFDPEEMVNKVLNENIDVAAPRRLQIVKFDSQTAKPRQFEVAEVDGVWSIPSKEDYPADATKQMAEAATCVIDRKILRVAGREGDTHEQFGVVDPLAPNLNSKSKGIGTRVTMIDADDNKIVDLIVGKQVKDSPGQYYVRIPEQGVTYVVDLDPSKLSTNFADWIEDDLLKLSAFDVRKVTINDYSADLGLVLTPQGPQARVNWDRRGEFTLGYNDTDAKWTAIDLKKFDTEKGTSGEWVPDKLADDEELNQDALNNLRNGLDDLLIVDVARKPAGLSNDLKAGKDFLSNRTAFEDLIEKGFSPVPIKPGAEPEILSSEGEVICTERNGVEYVLRFGQLQLQTDGEGDAEKEDEATADAAGEKKADDAKADDPKAADVAKADEKKPAEKKADDQKSDAANLRRYLFVMARMNKDIVEQPKLKELPELPKDDAAKEGDAAKADEKPAETADAKADEKKDEGADDKAAGDAKAKEEDKQKLDALIAERKAIEAENQHLLDEYNETLKSGEKKVAELNQRFGDWYYVISNDVYKQIHLGRAEIIKKKEASKDPAAAPGAGGLPALPGATPPGVVN